MMIYTYGHMYCTHFAGDRPPRSPGVDPKQLAAELQKVSQQQAPTSTSSSGLPATTSATSSPAQPGSPSISKKRHSSKASPRERGGGGGGGCQVLKFRLWPGLFQLQMTVYNQKCQYHHEHWVASYHSLHPSLKLHFVELIFARFCNIRVGYFYVIMRTTFATELWLCWKRVIKPNGAYPRCMLRSRCIDAESVTQILASNTPWSTFAVQ